MIKPAYGYRIEYGGRSVVTSGDTRYHPNVIAYGAGADLVIHEVAAARPELMKEAFMQRIIGHHTTPQEAGRVFSQARPKLAVYTHLVLPASEQILAVTLARLVRQVNVDGLIHSGETGRAALGRRGGVSTRLRKNAGRRKRSATTTQSAAMPAFLRRRIGLPHFEVFEHGSGPPKPWS